MKKISILLLFFLAQFALGQSDVKYAYVDNKMALIPSDSTTTTLGIANYINANFKSQDEKIRAVYYWLTNNIAYDVVSMYQPNNQDSPQVKITNTLKFRKGVCIHYAEVFNEIANTLGIKTYIIGGYIKQLGEIGRIAHAWNVSKIDGKWFLFDATWGAGSIEENKFLKKPNETYFKPSPDRMIVTHMPFDYMWQLLNQPLTNNEFISGKLDTTKSKSNYDFISEIAKYEALSDAEKALEASKRIEKNGLANSMIQEHYNLKKSEFTIRTQNSNIGKFTEIAATFNAAISDLNAFILLRNNKFKPTQSDETLRKMIQDVRAKIDKCKEDVYKVGSVSNENAANVNNLKKAILAGIEKTKENEDFLKEYLSKDQAGRTLMFTNRR